jgi:hypothetical protein
MELPISIAKPPLSISGIASRIALALSQSPGCLHHLSAWAHIPKDLFYGACNHPCGSLSKASEFCRRQSERLLALARETEDLAVQKELAAIASEWLVMAKEENATKRHMENNHARQRARMVEYAAPVVCLRRPEPDHY